jgi:cytochrome P450/NADPH-cytochrome P450 reductase
VTATVPIPKPKGDPFIGNLRAIDGDAPIQSFMRMAKMLGPIFQLEVLGSPIVFVGSQALIDEVSDESRFDKRVAGALRNIRDFAGDGLFTARTDEPNWAKAIAS